MAEFDFAPLEPPAPQPPAPDVEDIVASAHAEAAAIRAAAHAEGFAAGHAEALEAVAPAVAALEQARAAAGERAEATAERLEGEAVDLGFAVAQKIVGAVVAADPSQVLEAIRGALRGIVERERVTVLVSPEDLELVRAASEELRVSLGGIEHCEIQAERRVARGGAVVRYADGQVDARVQTKLERAREVVEESLAG